MTDWYRMSCWLIVAACFLFVGAVICRELFEELMATR